MVKGRRQQIQGPGNANKQHGGRCGKQEIRLKRKAKLGSEGSLGWWSPLKEVLGRKELGIPRDTAVKINCIWLLTGCEPGRELDNSRTLSTEFSGKNIEVGSDSFSRGSSWPRDWTWVSCIADGFFTIWTTREAPLLTMLASWAEEMWKCNSALKIIEKWLNISIMVNFACLSSFVTVWVPWSRLYFVRAASTHLVCCIRVWTDHALLHFTKYGAASLVRLWAAMISDISEAWETWCGYNGMDHMDKLKRFGDFSI